MGVPEDINRLDLWLSPQHKLIERAAAVKRVSERDWDRFTKLLDAAEPNDALREAAKKYLGKHGTAR